MADLRAYLKEGQQVAANSLPVVLSSDVNTVDTELPAAAALADNAANPTTPLVGACLLGYDGTTWDRIYTIADGDAVAAGTKGFLSLGTDGSNYQALKTDSSGELQVDVLTLPAVDTELPAAAALADNAANPTTPLIGACLLGYDGTTWDRIYTVADGDAVAAGTKGFILLGTDGANYQVLKTDSAGELQVDVLTGGGSDTPTTPVTDYVTSAALAAGSEANLDTADIPAKKLWQVSVWASVAYRVRIFVVNNSVEGTEALAIGGGPAMQGWTWTPPHRNFTTLGTSGGTDAFRAEVTNLDDANAADVHAVFAYADN
jgi:hypothetical protein